MQNTYPVLHGNNNLRLETHPVPELKSNEVLMRMSQCGLCGTDLSMVYKGLLADISVTYPSGVGHEASGVVVKMGKDVNHLKIGDRVCIEPSNHCRSCHFCFTDRYNVCDQSSFHNSVALYPGCLAKYYTSRADLVFKLPDSVSDEEGAFIEPLAVAVHACRRAGVKLASTVLITGAGPIGLLCLLTAKAMGATNIMVTDIKANRLEMAKKMGADHTLVVGGKEGAQQGAQKVKEVMGTEPQITLECSGSVAGLTFGYPIRGVLMTVGLLPPEVNVPLVYCMVREVDVKGVFRYVDCFPPAIEMIAKGLIDVKPLITHRFKFSEFQKAFDMFKTGQDGAIKCMISCE